MGRFIALRDQIALDWKWGYTLLPIAIASILAARTRESWFYLSLLLVFLIVWIRFTHLQGRFLILALPVAALAIGHAVEKVSVLRIPAAIIVSLAAAVGLKEVHARYGSHDHRKPGTLAAIIDAKGLGVDVLDWLVPVDLSVLREDETLILVGDSRAFLYSRPMSKLHYQTVFDTTASSFKFPSNSVLLVDPAELRRLSDKYFGMAPPPELLKGDHSYLMKR